MIDADSVNERADRLLAGIQDRRRGWPELRYSSTSKILAPAISCSGTGSRKPECGSYYERG